MILIRFGFRLEDYNSNGVYQTTNGGTNMDQYFNGFAFNYLLLCYSKHTKYRAG